MSRAVEMVTKILLVGGVADGWTIEVEPQQPGTDRAIVLTATSVSGREVFRVVYTFQGATEGLAIYRATGNGKDQQDRYDCR